MRYYIIAGEASGDQGVRDLAGDAAFLHVAVRCEESSEPSAGHQPVTPLGVLDPVNVFAAFGAITELVFVDVLVLEVDASPASF